MKRPIRFALFGNVYQPRKAAPMQQLLDALRQHEAEIIIDTAFHRFLTEELRLSVPTATCIEGNDFEADYVLSVGGDGTFLEAARRVAEKEIPILGINMGRLGFLSDFTPDDVDLAIRQICEGRIRSEARSVLELQYSEGQPAGHPYALNEVAVLKRDNSSMISIRVDINSEYLTTYQADGLILNTPTGSTGYALSVGGPIMHPGSATLGLVPVAPHSLNVRPVTLDDDMEVTLTVESRSHNFLVAIDGRSESCREGVRLLLRRAPFHVFVLKRPESSFFGTLRTKLMWGSDARDKSPLPEPSRDGKEY